MDPSIFKLLEEDDEDESMHSKEEVDAFQASLIREIEGGNHSWSQQMKAQQQSVLANQDRELNPEDVSLSHHNQPQELLQPNPLCENHNMSVQRTHGVEQPVGSVNLGPTHLQVCELIRILIPQVDKDRGNQLPSLYYKFKSKEITKYRFLRKVRNIVGDRMTLWAVRKLQQQGDKGVKLPDGPNHYRESFTSADQSLIQSLTEDVSAKKSDTPGVHVNQLPSASLGILSSSATVHEFNNSERPTSLPLYSVPCQGPVTKDQSMSNEQTVAHVKQKLTGQSFDQVRKPCSLVRKDVSNVPMELSNNNPRRSNDDLVKQSSEMILSASTTHANFASASLKTQLDSSTMVNFSAPTATIPPGTIVRTIQGQKKTLEAQGSSLPPLR